MKTYLKIKIMSLAAEARIIRREEKKWPGPSDVRIGLHHHRVKDVRWEARHSLLAYGFLRGRKYLQVENKASSQPDWDYVSKLIEKFGALKPQVLRQQFAEWKPQT